jgi:hypothetical protein
MVAPPKNMVASPNICLRHLILLTTNMVAPSIKYGCAASNVYQYGCAASYGCATDCLRFVASPMVAPPKNMVVPPNIWLRHLALQAINMVASSIDMVAPLVIVVQPIICIWLHRLWLHLQKIYWHCYHSYGCTV